MPAAGPPNAPPSEMVCGVCCAVFAQVFLGPNGGTDTEGNILPRMVYVSREKRPGYNHHKKAGAMNALVSCRGLTQRCCVPGSHCSRGDETTEEVQVEPP